MNWEGEHDLEGSGGNIEFYQGRDIIMLIIKFVFFKDAHIHEGTHEASTCTCTHVGSTAYIHVTSSHFRNTLPMKAQNH